MPRKVPLTPSERRARKSELKRERGIAEGTLIRKARVNRLKSPADWQRELARLWRHARRGKIRLEDASRFAYVAKIAVDISQIVAQREEIARLEALLSSLAPNLSLASPDDTESLDSADSPSITHNLEN